MTFQDLTMDGTDIFNLLQNPKDLDQKILTEVFAWTKPKWVKGNITNIMVMAGAVESISQAIRKIKEGAVCWNGKGVTNIKMDVEFFSPGFGFGWGVIKIGKRHWVVKTFSSI